VKERFGSRGVCASGIAWRACLGVAPPSSRLTSRDCRGYRLSAVGRAADSRKSRQRASLIHSPESVSALAGKTALVTGGGRGVGRVIAKAFAAEGARVAVAARTETEIESVAAECGAGTIAIRLDVSDEMSCVAAVDRCVRELGVLDILVNNAGVASSDKFTRITTAEWAQTLAVDLTGPFWLTRAALPQMLERGAGSVIAIASIVSRIGLPYVVHYTAAKHGLLGMMRALAAENALSGVNFNCICPGYIDTPMTQTTILNIMRRTGRTRDEALKPLLTPQGRLIDPKEVAALCVFLASDWGRSITGQAIMLDGGQVQA